MPELNDILDAVDALSRPVHVRVTQEIPKGKQVIQIEHPPLLEQLEAAIRGEMNSAAGSSESLPSTRGMLNADALYAFTRITAMIRDWSHMVHAPRRDTITEQLRAWFVVFSQTDKDGAFQLRVMRGWKSLIEATLDPPDELVHPDACPNPECPQEVDEYTGRPTWWDSKMRERRTDPLVTHFRRTDREHVVENAVSRCRACGTVWSARALQYELEQVAEIAEAAS